MTLLHDAAPLSSASGITTSRVGGLEILLSDLAEDGRVVHIETIAPRPQRTATLARPLPESVWSRVPVTQLWTHQAHAIDLIRDETSVAVATGTASGKSLCYQLPIAEAAIDTDVAASALCLFPTKALAHDQLRSVAAFGFERVTAATYDGDTAHEHRRWVRDHANVVLTNPEMLHGSILPDHHRWAGFLRRLRHVVIDELHVLRGVFGTHMAHLLRRLQRLCEHYGSRPTFVFTSATLGNPGRLAADLCGQDVTEIVDDGSPRGRRLFALLDPPILDQTSGARASSNAETASLVSRLVAGGHRTISFCASRKGTELVAAHVRSMVEAELADSVRSYRGGYLPEERRQIELDVNTGATRAIIATSALELGVDIGDLDACILNGFPGTIASMWQQAGRAGREQQDSVAVLVAGEDQLDRYFMNHPDEVFSRPPEPAVINPANSTIADPHIACAAYELPLTWHDQRWWGPQLEESVRRLVLDDKLRVRRRGTDMETAPPVAVWSGRASPARSIGLRSSSSREYRICRRDGTLVGTVDEARAFASVHPGAVYLHRGAPFRVTDLDLGAGVATVVTDDGETYTQARTVVDISVVQADESIPVGRADIALGTVEVRSQVVGYQRRDVRSRRVLNRESLDLPATQLVTRSFWYTIPEQLLADAGVRNEDVAGTLHALEHTAISMLPLFTICDRWDVGGVSTARHPDTLAPSIFIYDGYAGGAGIAELGYQVADRHLGATLSVLEACPCAAGCPSCVQSPKCGNGNEPLDKAGAIALLRTLLEQDVSG